jgi:hypothetical protein
VSEQYNRFGWESTLASFASSDRKVIRLRLEEFLANSSPEQIRAWDDCIPWLQREYQELIASDSIATTYGTFLEYELPRDARRPDVLVLELGCVVVLEIKGHPSPSQAAIDQVFGYARDLAAYHTACANRPVWPVLVTRGRTDEPIQKDGVYLTSPEHLDSLLHKLSDATQPLVASRDFLRADTYAPLPSIVQAARDLFNHRPLPFIKRARASTEPALKHISEIAKQAAATKSRHLVLLSGVPGSGKTLVGLQLVHAGWLDEIAVSREAGRPTTAAVYLSGNGPLVQVLQYALRDAGGGGRTFVQDIKKYVEYYSRRASAPPEHLIVFDEAQRAHDAERVAHVHSQPIGLSEPDHLLEFCERIPQWSVLVALIGEGQAIHVGEEGGVSLWARALDRLTSPGRWHVHGPSRFMEHFSQSKANLLWNESLNLDTEIRFHLTPKVHAFVTQLLNHGGDAAQFADELNCAGHRFLIARDLRKAKAYMFERYGDAPNVRYGLLASSKDKWLEPCGVDNTFQTTKRLRVGPWYNAEPSDPASCCQLTTVATEFSSQGLELDCALLAWGSDLLWDKGWSIDHSRRTRGSVSDPLAIRKNVYRVLLTRGRDGTVTFVPDDRRFDTTYKHLVESGFRVLQ